jgi:hypothetical protein
VAVKGTPALCAAKDGDPDKLTYQWFFGEGPCALSYAPSRTAVVTTLSLGDMKGILASPASRERLDALLRELDASLSAAPPGLQDRLNVHTTIWEVVYGLKRSGEREPQWAADLAPLLCRAVGLLRRTSFSHEDAARLPATLGDLPRLAATPEIAPLVERLISHDPSVVEVSPATDLHADLLFGRFTARIFLTAAEPAERDGLRKIVQDPSLAYWKLKALPESVAGVEGVLVLFFNVLGPDESVIPTEQVAVWQQYAFEGKVPIALPFAEAARRIRFRTIEYQRNLRVADAPPAYRTADPSAMSGQGLLNVKPARAGAWVSTQRAQCLGCHTHQVATFDTHGRRRVDFLAPLTRGGPALLTAYYGDRIEGRLRGWAGECPSRAADGLHPARGAAPGTP